LTGVNHQCCPFITDVSERKKKQTINQLMFFVAIYFLGILFIKKNIKGLKLFYSMVGVEVLASHAAGESRMTRPVRNKLQPSYRQQTTQRSCIFL
jgi:hypothetical protein